MQKAEPQYAGGILIFGWLLIASSVIQIYQLIAQIPWYAELHSYLSAEWIVLRYAFSWFLRIVGILIGAGLLASKEIARKAILALSWFAILTIYWKNPLASEKLQCAYMQRQFGNPLAEFGIRDAASFVAPYVTAFLCVEHVIFYGIVIYYFTRPAVRRHFR